MRCCVVGAGLVGTFLGALAGADAAVCGPTGWDGPRRVRRPGDGRLLTWEPELLTVPAPGPCLIATRVPDTPGSLLSPSAWLAQNGLGQPGRVLACFVAVDRTGEGIYRETAGRPRLVVPTAGPEWVPVIAAWRDAGLVVEEVPDTLPARWEKCILNATVGPLCLATGRSMRAVWRDPELRALSLRATEECLGLARYAGVGCAPDLRERAAAFFAACGPHRPSVVADPSELPWVLGYLETLRQNRADCACPALAEIVKRVGRVVPADLLVWPRCAERAG